MDKTLAERLNALNTAFYAENAASFSETRKAPWPGWYRCAELMGALGAAHAASGHDRSLHVVDVASGNLRFESFLVRALPDVSFSFTALDNCADLVGGSLAANLEITFQPCDIVNDLFQDSLVIPQGDVVTSFGFFHHVPGEENRVRLLRALVDAACPSGLIMISLWQFMKNETMAARALQTTNQAQAYLTLPALDDGDYLLGWKNKEHQYRYCHSFSEGEIDDLVASVADGAVLKERFCADGRTHDLNTYLVFEKVGV